MCVCTFHIANVRMANTSSPSIMARMMTQRGIANDTSGVPHNTIVPICRIQTYSQVFVMSFSHISTFKKHLTEVVCLGRAEGWMW